MTRSQTLGSRARRSLLALAVFAGTGLAQAQGTDVPLRLIVPFTPGTGIDLIARTIGPKLSERLKRPVVVDNRAGASGNIGTEAVVRAAPDGNTLLVSVNTLVMNRSLYPQAPFDPLRDLTPVGLTSWGQLMLVTHPKTGFKTASDLVDAARRAPGKLNYASPGVGTPHHLSMELFKNASKSFITHIPYRGTGPALTDMIGGQVDAMFLPIHVALPQIRSGRLVALAIGSDSTADVNVDMWYGVFAPKGMAPALVATLNREINSILASEDVKKAFSGQGMDPSTGTPEAFGQLVQKDAERWADLIKTQNIKAE